ncbi:3-ketoacyl-ACP reductase [Vibrio nigripulchritudo]|uniref:3-ketoacyl-ACP reductase n=1 Tax=Vibrio nigripulchritudo TaxID=28173 RepID=UPI0024925049|nr:3-ketoacyl-ACP reductase [Vibrio nigripulchritudo]BDU39497.1 3-ketoacyl-ACP reductase [Vibrio nigripulchritudo]BDU45218.1 3-ketoacyl-ACP reductase [Vibrio nigripulchritudo]
MSSPVALVTGGARGIGKAIALALAKSGYRVAVNDREDSPALHETLAELEKISQPHMALCGDVSDIDSHANWLKEVETSLGSITTLVNNAGVSVQNRGDLLDVTPESYDRCQLINTKAMFFLSQAFAKVRVANPVSDHPVSIINITSSNAKAASENRSEYCVSKAAAAMVSNLFAVRLGRENIAVYDIQPGLIETEMTAPSMHLYRERVENGFTLLPRIGVPEEVGKVVTSLATGQLPYTTGQTISVDAGMLVSRF